MKQAPRLSQIAAACLALGAGFSTHAYCQEDQAAAVSGEDGQGKVETVVVSAQRRMERLQDVPVSVKAFSSKQIDAMGITSTQDFINLTPNMSFDNSYTYGNSFVVLRGVTQINNADSPVAVVVDGVPQNDQKQLKMSLFDVERIEVLKGPQGALYGRNAIGGAINIETRAPGNKLEGFAGADVGSGGSKEVTGGISGALKEDVAFFRVVGQSKRSNGQIENTYLGRKVDAIDHDNSLRAKLLLRPNDATQIDLRASVVDFRAPAIWDSIVSNGDAGTITQPRENLLGSTKGHTDDFSAKLQVNFEAFTLTSITSRSHVRENNRGDIDFSNPRDLPGGFFGFGFQAGQGQNHDARLTSQELRFTSPDDRAVRWIAGAYYLDTRKEVESRVFIDTNQSLGQFDDTSKVIVDNNEDNHNKASALFGQLDIDIDKDLILSTALRLDRDERRQVDKHTQALRTASYSKWQPKATLTKKLGNDKLVYGTVSTGFRSGGFNAPGLPDFGAESLVNLEAGSKLMLLDGRLMLNAAAFASRSKGFQYFYVDAKSGSQIIANIDRVDIKGLDVDFRYVPVKGLEFDGGLGVTDSEIKSDSAQPGNVGKHTPKNVPFKVNLGAQYSYPLAGGMQGTARFDVEHRDKKYWHPDNLAVSPALTLLGLRFGLHGARERWSLTLYGKNLADKRYYADYNAKRYSGLPYDIGSLAPRRTIGLEAKWRFE